MRQRVAHSQLGQASVEAGHVLFEAEQLAGIDRYHFVHAVAKNKATVHDADLGVGKRGEVAVEVAGE